MGWSLALHICHEAVDHLASNTAKSVVCGLLHERFPISLLEPSSAALRVYVDSVCAIGTALDSDAVLRLFSEARALGGVTIEFDTDGDEDVQVAGLELF